MRNTKSRKWGEAALRCADLTPQRSAPTYSQSGSISPHTRSSNVCRFLISAN
jgi:hypothetical protein